jgi:hypothetical protein
MARLELKYLELRPLSLSNSKTMKKLIGLLGAAGLLIPSAAMAGSLGNSSGTDALRTTSASYSVQKVGVKSNIFRKNDMHVSGDSYGKTHSYSAEDYVTGGGALTYSEHDFTGQSAAEIDIDHLRANGRWNIDVKNTEHSNNFSKDSVPAEGGKPDDCGRKGCKTSKGKGGKGPGPSKGKDQVTTKRDRHNSRDVLDTKGHFSGSANGRADYAATLDTQTSVTALTGGQGGLKNGSYSESFDKYTGHYKGDLFERGWTKTKVDAKTDTVTTSNGFESGHFNTTEWN